MSRFELGKTLSLDNIASSSTAVWATIGGVFGSIVETVYGGGEERKFMIAIYAFFIFMDWISGIAASKKDGSYSSEYGINGVLRTLFILCFPAAANMLDYVLNTPGVIFYFVTTGLIFHTFNSLTANSVRAGWEKWIPNSIINFVQSEIENKSNRSSKNTEEK
ncbi:phage holin family protein (plasmid) [Paenibacillus urinalis]|uniref:Phage holin family protein n=1 Tax=Paenibacillus urinalis TaxID=521520 RepID=A0ABY7XH51_9BACL|nr:phage holin family protein [Paenibacillus urinalis]WDI05089.1 phage holin family protein [Paenibacillus urinalis]